MVLIRDFATLLSNAARRAWESLSKILDAKDVRAMNVHFATLIRDLNAEGKTDKNGLVTPDEVKAHFASASADDVLKAIGVAKVEEAVDVIYECIDTDKDATDQKYL